MGKEQMSFEFVEDAPEGEMDKAPDAKAVDEMTEKILKDDKTGMMSREVAAEIARITLGTRRSNEKEKRKNPDENPDDYEMMR